MQTMRGRSPGSWVDIFKHNIFMRLLSRVDRNSPISYVDFNCGQVSAELNPNDQAYATGVRHLLNHVRQCRAERKITPLQDYVDILAHYNGLTPTLQRWVPGENEGLGALPGRSALSKYFLSNEDQGFVVETDPMEVPQVEKLRVERGFAVRSTPLNSAAVKRALPSTTSRSVVVYDWEVEAPLENDRTIFAFKMDGLTDKHSRLAAEVIRAEPQGHHLFFYPFLMQRPIDFLRAVASTGASHVWKCEVYDNNRMGLGAVLVNPPLGLHNDLTSFVKVLEGAMNQFESVHTPVGRAAAFDRSREDKNRKTVTGWLVNTSKPQEANPLSWDYERSDDRLVTPEAQRQIADLTFGVRGDKAYDVWWNERYNREDLLQGFAKGFPLLNKFVGKQKLTTTPTTNGDAAAEATL